MRFTIDASGREPATKLEKHLVTVATAWCNGLNVKPIDSLDDFKKYLEKELAWYCLDHKKADPASVAIGFYDETMLFIKPAGADVRATVTIRAEQTPNWQQPYGSRMQLLRG